MSADRNIEEEGRPSDQADAESSQDRNGEQKEGEESSKPVSAGLADILFIPVVVGIGIGILAGFWKGVIAGIVALIIEVLFLRGLRDPQ